MSIGQDEPYTQSLLLAAYQQTAAELLATLARTGHAAVRHKHGAVFANIDPTGTRPSVLAERAGMTKAALGELVDELEDLGYVIRQTDPSDRRAKLVVPTAKAEEVATLVRQVNERIERRYRHELGDVAYSALRRTLMSIIPSGQLLVQPRMTVSARHGRRGGPSEVSSKWRTV